MKKDRLVAISKFLSLVLRHKPEKAGISLDSSGWVEVSKLLLGSNASGIKIMLDELEVVVAASDKKRFSLSDDGLFIRANYGHSLAINLGLEPHQPPEILYHGTVERFLPSIRQSGILKKNRQYVHFSSDRDTAQKVGLRRGKPVIIKVDSGLMHREGAVFYQSLSGIWLTEKVPPKYLHIPG